MPNFTRTEAEATRRIAPALICSSCFAALALSSVTSHAADLARPVYKAPPAVSIFSWTGLYAGGHLGWGSVDRTFQQTSVGGILTVNPGFTQTTDGLTGGGQIGFNQQIGSWVWGLEAEVSAANLDVKTLAVPPIAVPQTYDVSLGWMAILGGRLGYSWDRWLVYGKGGAALLRETYSMAATGLFTPESPLLDAKVARLGWMAGAGVENAFADHWSWKVEYNYLRFDGSDGIANVVSGTSNSAFANWADVAIHTVKAGVNYRFANARGSAAPGIYKAAAIADHDWTGLYVGGNIGWSSVDRGFNSNVGVTGVGFNPGFDQKADGVIGGAQIGFNWQTGNWVIGLEADVSASDIKASSTVFDPTTTTIEQTYGASVDWIAAGTGRLGYAWDRWMVYGKGGAALAREKYSASIPLLGPRQDAQATRLGWTIGAGIENAILDNWSWKFEYNYMKFESIDAGHTGLITNAAGVAIHTSLDAHLLKLGVNYKFGGYGRAPIAKF